MRSMGEIATKSERRLQHMAQVAHREAAMGLLEALYLKHVTGTGEWQALAELVLEERLNGFELWGEMILKLGGNPECRAEGRCGSMHLRQDGTPSARALTYWLRRMRRREQDTEKRCGEIAALTDRSELLSLCDRIGGAAERVREEMDAWLDS